jgi:hypothetical protein
LDNFVEEVLPHDHFSSITVSEWTQTLYEESIFPKEKNHLSLTNGKGDYDLAYSTLGPIKEFMMNEMLAESELSEAGINEECGKLNHAISFVFRNRHCRYLII